MRDFIAIYIVLNFGKMSSAWLFQFRWFINLQTKKLCSFYFLYILSITAYVYVAYGHVISYKFYEVCFTKFKVRLLFMTMKYNMVVPQHSLQSTNRTSVFCINIGQYIINVQQEKEKTKYSTLRNSMLNVTPVKTNIIMNIWKFCYISAFCKI